MVRLMTGPAGRAIHADLRQELEVRTDRDGEASARRWFVIQCASVGFWSMLDRLRGREWRGVGNLQHRSRPSGRAPGSSPKGASGRSGTSSALQPGEGLRVFRRAPGYAAAVTGTLGLAMAATVSVYSVVDAVILTDSPYPEPERLVRVDHLGTDGVSTDAGVSYLDFRDWSSRTTSLGSMAAWQDFQAIYVADGIAQELQGASGTPDLLATLGVRPLLGTLPPGGWEIGENVVYLSHGLWTRRFGQDPQIVGSTITLSEVSWEVRGVMPAGFAFPDEAAEFWVPTRQSGFLENRGASFLNMIGRLQTGVGVGQAQAEMGAIATAVDQEFGNGTGRSVVVRGWDDVLIAPVRRTLWIFMGAVLFFLLAACTNIAGLSLSRLESRRREIAVRRALGAGEVRIRGHLLSESMTLGIAGGLLGVVASFWGVRLLLWLAPADLPHRSEIGVDWSVVVAGIGLSVLCGLMIGVLPAFRAGAGSTSPLRDRAAGAMRGQQRLHSVVAGAQIALAVVLLFGSGLMLRSFDRLTGVDTGFDAPDRVLTVELGLGRERWGDAERVLDFHQQLLQSVRDLPGVEAASISSHLPFSGSRFQAAMARDDRPYRRVESPLIRIEVVTEDYFEVMGTEVRGRLPSSEAEAREAVINESAARALWPNEEPIGHSFSFWVDEGEPTDPTSRYRVVGVVPDLLDDALGREKAARAYYSLPEFVPSWDFVSGRFVFLAVRTTGDPAEVLPAVRTVIAGIDPNVPVDRAMTLSGRMMESVVAERFRTLVLSFFAGLAIIVALIGVHGVIAFGVRRGMRDIGVRLALGANSSEVRMRVLRRAGVMALVGGAFGLIGAVVVGSVIERMLFQVELNDPITLGAVALVAIGGALLAALPPALRAARVDPVTVMREE